MGGVIRLLHADWSVSAPGRRLARATLRDGRWHAEAPGSVPPLDRFVAELLEGSGTLLAGFDFPIGLPARIGAALDAPDLPAGLHTLPPRFFEVADRVEDVGPSRPFYPARPGGRSHAQLMAGHGVTSMDALMRRCERAARGRRAAGCMFWTLGAAQVGRAALHGWRHVVQPAHRLGARLWPFDGPLHRLAMDGALILAETYPADGYGRLGAPFGPGESKRRQSDRASKAAAIRSWAATHDVALSPALAATLDDGFGPADRGGDSFDAVVGLLAMIDVLEHGPVDPPDDPDVRRWEGWIFGRSG